MFGRGRSWLLAVLLMDVGAASAFTCTTNTGGLPAAGLRLDYNAPASAIPIDTSVGLYEPLAPPFLLINSFGSRVVSCDEEIGPVAWFVSRPFSSQTWIFETGIPGVGMTLRALAHNGRPGTTIPSYNWTESGYAFEAQGLPVEMQLIKTANTIGPGNIPVGELAYLRQQYWRTLLYSMWLSSPILIGAVRPTCNVVGGGPPTTRFRPVPANVAGPLLDTQPLSLALACSGGSTGMRVPVSVTLTDASRPGNTTDTLSLALDSSASGLGIKLFFSGNPIYFGPANGAVGNPARWSAGNATNGVFNIPLVAELTRTGPITPGTFSANATFIIDYQ